MGLHPPSAGSGTGDLQLAPYADWPAALQAAYNTLAAGNGGVIQLPAGLLASTGSAATFFIRPSATQNGTVVIRGKGRRATTVQLTANTYALVGVTATTAGDLYGRILIEDLTVDANGASAEGLGVVTHFDGDELSFDEITVRRVDTINCGGLTGSGRRNVFIRSQQSTIGDDGTPRTITNILVEDCNFGRSGGGSNTGILISGLNNATKTANALYNAVPGTSNIFIDNIRVSRFRWGSGATPTVSASSSGVMVGGWARVGKVELDKVDVSGCADTGIELDSAQDATLRDVVSTDCWGSNFYISNLGGDPDGRGGRTHTQKVRLDNCIAKRVNLSRGNGFHFNMQYAVALGDVEMNGCRLIHTNATITTGVQAIQTMGALRSLSIRDFKAKWSGFTTISSNGQVCGLYLNSHGGRSRVTIDGLHVEADGSLTTGQSLTVIGVQGQSAVDVALDAQGVSGRNNVTGAGTFSMREWDLFPGTLTVTDAFGSDTLSTDYVLDAGTAGDLAVTGGAITSVANHAAEKRYVWLQLQSSAAGGQVGELLDGSMSMKFTPGATLTGWKGGVMLRRLDNQNYLECYVTDDGTQSLLKIDKVVAGVRTNLAVSAALATRISNGVAHWVRGKIQGDLVTADYYTSAPGAVSGSGAATQTTTLAGTDATTFGASGRLGRPGFTWTPVDAAATADDIKHDRMHVIRGRIAAVTPMGNQQPISAHTAVQWTQGNSLVRIAGRLRIENSDLAGLKPATTVTDISLPADATIKSGILIRNVVHNTPPAPAAITVGASPFTYTNQDAYSEDVPIFGGTVSSVTVTRAGASAQQVASATGVTPRLDPGDAVTVTYSVVPTMAKSLIP